MLSLSKLLSKHRNAKLNYRLGLILAYVAGFINAGGFFIVKQYTSHVTGIASIAADNIAVGNYLLGFFMIGFIFCFIIGAITTTIIVICLRKKHLYSQYALPILLEGGLLILVIILQSYLKEKLFLLPLTIAILCFLMGLQNVLITKASSSIIRTTHITGMSTDLGIEIGRFLSRNTKNSLTKIYLHLSIMSIFFIGGVTGAYIVSNIGALGLTPIIVLLMVLSFYPIKNDIYFFIKIRKRNMRNLSRFVGAEPNITTHQND